MPLYVYPADGGGHFMLHGELGNHCADCSRVADWLCDYPIGGGHTCDRSVCEYHGHVVGDDMHYCQTHYREWRADNPDRGDYRMTHYRLLTLPGYSWLAMDMLGKHYNDMAESFPELSEKSLRHNAASLMGTAHDPAQQYPEPDPRVGLVQGVAWLIKAGLAACQWRKLPGEKPLPYFMLTERGHFVSMGETIEAENNDE